MKEKPRFVKWSPWRLIKRHGSSKGIQTHRDKEIILTRTFKISDSLRLEEGVLVERQSKLWNSKDPYEHEDSNTGYHYLTVIDENWNDDLLWVQGFILSEKPVYQVFKKKDDNKKGVWTNFEVIQPWRTKRLAWACYKKELLKRFNTIL